MNKDLLAINEEIDIMLKKPPKKEVEILNEKVDSLDKKVEKILKLLKNK